MPEDLPTPEKSIAQLEQEQIGRTPAKGNGWDSLCWMSRSKEVKYPRDKLDCPPAH